MDNAVQVQRGGGIQGSEHDEVELIILIESNGEKGIPSALLREQSEEHAKTLRSGPLVAGSNGGAFIMASRLDWWRDACKLTPVIR